MKILVIDDQPKKYMDLKPVLDEIFPENICTHTKTFSSGISLLETGLWDYVFLDMSFKANDNPSEETGFEGLAGLTVLQHMRRSRIVSKVIIFTAHANFEDPEYEEIVGIGNLEKHVSTYFGSLCLGCVNSNDTTKNTILKIRRLINNGE